MPLKVVDPLDIGGFADRLAYIVKEHGQPENRIARYQAKGLQSMFSHRVSMVGIVLFRIHETVKFRQKNRSQTALIGKTNTFRVI